jgi:raffinose/stachyose/melibiose transport system permease protein
MGARISRHGVLLLVSLVYLVPLYLIVVNSLKTTDQFLLGPMDLPIGNLTLDNYAGALGANGRGPGFDFPAAFGFSVLYATTTVILAIVLGGGLSYQIARSRRRRATLLYLGLVAGLIIPPQVLVIPIVKVLAFLGLLFSFPGLVLVETSANIPFVVFILVPFIRSVPVELDESAELDGASPFTTYWRIVFPLLRPAVVSLAVLIFAAAWNDFINPQILLRPGEAYTVTTGIYRSIGLYTSDWGAVFANIVLAAAPVMILFVVLQRYVIGGLTHGAVRG